MILLREILLKEKLKEFCVMEMHEVVKKVWEEFNREVSMKEVKKELKKFMENKRETGVLVLSDTLLFNIAL